MARHAREHGPAAGHECLARLVQGTVCKILGQEEIKLIKPHKGALLSIATTALDLPPEPGVHATFARGPLARAVCGAASSMGWPPQRSVPLVERLRRSL